MNKHYNAGLMAAVKARGHMASADINDLAMNYAIDHVELPEDGPENDHLLDNAMIEADAVANDWAAGYVAGQSLAVRIIA